MVGVNGKKFPDIRAHLEKNIAGVYKNLDVSWVILLYLIQTYLYIPFSSFEEFPKDGLVDPEACTYPALPFVHCKSNIIFKKSIDKIAINKMEPGEAVIIFTPDSKYTDYFIFFPSLHHYFCASIATHYPIAIYAIERGLHVLITKPTTQLLSHHNALIEAARKK